jgi:hypothetical protein
VRRLSSFVQIKSPPTSIPLANAPRIKTQISAVICVSDGQRWREAGVLLTTTKAAISPQESRIMPE